MLHKVTKQPFESARVAASFRRGLKSYDQNASVQYRIATQLVGELKKACSANQFEHAFEFGCGTGYLTKQLVENFQIKDFVVNDLVAECGASVQAIAPNATFTRGAVQDMELPADLDLVASSSAIQWVPELSDLIENTAAKLNIGGFMALSGFGHGHFDELQQLGSRAIAPSYADDTELAAMLPSFMDVAYLKTSQIQLEFEGLLPLLRHLRTTGVNGRASGMLTKANFNSFEQRYASQFGRNGKLLLTYQPTWLIAQRQR